MSDKKTDEELRELQRFAYRFAMAKDAVKAAEIQRNAIRDEIANRIPTGERSQSTLNLRDGLKVTVKRDMSLTLDVDGLLELFKDDPDFVNLPMPTKPGKVTLDAKGYEWYLVNHPELFAKIVKYVTSKPKPVSVTVKLPEEK